LTIPFWMNLVTCGEEGLAVSPSPRVRGSFPPRLDGETLAVRSTRSTHSSDCDVFYERRRCRRGRRRAYLHLGSTPLTKLRAGGCGLPWKKWSYELERPRDPMPNSPAVTGENGFPLETARVGLSRIFTRRELHHHGLTAVVVGRHGQWCGAGDRVGDQVPAGSVGAHAPLGFELVEGTAVQRLRVQRFPTSERECVSAVLLPGRLDGDRDWTTSRVAWVSAVTPTNTPPTSTTNQFRGGTPMTTRIAPAV
jgi:hypothetical protein